MSWYRQVKLLYEMCLLVFMFIMWSIIELVFLSRKPDYKVLIISIITGLFIDYLYSRESKKAVTFCVPYIIVCGIFYIIYKNNIVSVIFNSIYMLLAAAIIYKKEEEEPDYSECSYAVKKTVLILFLCGGIFAVCKAEYWKSFVRLYILYILIGIITLRESRLYSYALKNKKAVFGNIFTALVLIVLSAEKVFNSIIKLLIYIFKMIGYPVRAILNIIINVLLVIVDYPVLFIGEWLKKLMGKLPRQQQEQTQETGYKKNTLEMLRKVQSRELHMSRNTEIVIEVLIILTAVLLIIKLINKKSKSKTDFAEAEYEEKEKIYKDSYDKKNMIAQIIRSIFKTPTLKEQILGIYKNFEREADKKGIFKNHMTPTQLANVYAPNTESKIPLYDMKDIYNEVKFSEHNVTKEQLQKIKKDFSCI